MSEIEEMYKNAIEKQSYCTAHDCLDMSKCENCYFCKRIYPSFTAEKQIELIKWSARREPKVEIGYSSVCGYWVETPTDTRYYFGDQFDNALDIGMTEEIIINGVDVSGCEKQGETIAGITCGNGERIRLANEIITKHKLCKDNPNCV